MLSVVLNGRDKLQESRLFRILYYLLDKGRATAPELAEKFEVSVRTIYRDVDAISSAGISIYVTTDCNISCRLYWQANLSSFVEYQICKVQAVVFLYEKLEYRGSIFNLFIFHLRPIAFCSRVHFAFSKVFYENTHNYENIDIEK